MHRHFLQELERLKADLIRMSSLAEQAIADSIHAFLERDTDLAQQVIVRDERINSFEVQIDNEVVDLLALQQPVAVDLRFILAALKINNDLERIGDHAVNIAESAVPCADRPPLEAQDDIPRMADVTKGMLRDAIDGFIHSNTSLCRAVLQHDDVIDDLNRKVVRDMVTVIRTRPGAVDQALEIIRVSRNLERVADLATNIAEDVIFMTEAHVVKHHVERRAGE